MHSVLYFPCMKTNLRKADKNDLEAIQALHSLLNESRVKQYDLSTKAFHAKTKASAPIKDSNLESDIFIVAENESKIVGYVWGSIDKRPHHKLKKMGYIDELFIAQKYRKKGIETEMEDTKNYWKEIWGDNFERGPDEGVPVREALDNMPSLAEIRARMARLPDKASLPTVTDVIYDQLLYIAATGKPLFQGRAVATKSSVPPMEGIDDNIRPWDISFSDDGEIIIHFRRSDRMGRPHQLGQMEVGIPIAYIQH